MSDETTDGQEVKRNLVGLAGGVVAAAIVVNGILAIIPDEILRDRYGDVHGLFQLALSVIAVVVFTASWRWLDEHI